MKNVINRALAAKKKNYNIPATMVAQIASMELMQFQVGSTPVQSGIPIPGGGDPGDGI